MHDVVDAKLCSQRNSAESEFHNKAAGFDAPTQLPRNEAQRREWQESNRAWWERTPMRYDWRESLTEEPGTNAYFAEIDRRFIAAARGCLRWRKLPFDSVIPFDQLHNKDVLEIGVGQGTHAQLLSPRCKSFTGIDLTSYASKMTARRFRLFGLPGQIRQMDGEKMDFPDASFDYIWSWGVIHHSADTRRVLQEMHRVLRPSGHSTVMVYYRSWWAFYFCAALRRAFRHPFSSKAGVHEVVQGATDGAMARYYKPHEWRWTTSGLFEIDAMQVCGLKAEVLPLPHGRLKQTLETFLPNGVARFMTQRLRMGTFLIAHMRRV
jgi:ubiquinone/menaquinone biosynthesis C-methylase UbiE